MCRAAIDGRPDQWAVAQQLGPAVLALTPSSCLEKAAHDLLKRALAWRERNPGRQPAVRFPVVGDGTACRSEIVRVQLAVETDSGFEPAEGPLSGPVTGDTFIMIEGFGFGSAVVLVGGEEAEIVRNEPVSIAGEPGKRYVVRVPPVIEPAEAEITVRNQVGTMTTGERFRYRAL